MKEISRLGITALIALFINQVAFAEPHKSEGPPTSTPESTPNRKLIQRPIPAPSEDKDPFPINLPPPPPRRSGETPSKSKLKLSPSPLSNFSTNNDNAPIDDEGNLLIDATFGIKRCGDIS